MNDLVSIIMPSYNTARYIAETIQTVINQTYQNWELIIVDDCSTDCTDAVVEKIHDSRIRYIKNQKNSGAAISRNRALREAKGRWIAFLDSDDLWKPEKLEKQIRFMKNNKCYFSYTNYEEIDADGNKTNVVVTGPKVITKTGMFNYCWPGCLTVMYDRKKIGLIQIEDIKKNNDYAMWLKVCKKTRCYLLDEVLAEYRRGRTGSISTHGYKELIKWHYKLFRFAEKENTFFSLVNMLRNMLFGFYKKKKYVLNQHNRKKTNVCILGHFGENANLLNGQTVKTKVITEELQNQLGQDNVITVDTHGGMKTLAKAPFQVIFALKNSRNVLIFPAQNGLRIYVPLLSFFRHFFKDRKLYYVVIGGWLPQFLTKRKRLKKVLKDFDGIYVETGTMKRALDIQGFENVFIMPNCKKLNVLSENELVYPDGIPYKLCTFSRVMKEKGIETAVDIVKRVNERIGYIVYSLDIYGQIDSAQTQWFESLKEKFPDYVHYCGCVDANKSVDVLQNYFALLFPTHFYTEGIPGTIIDAYAAGIPVISAKWESFSDVVEDGKTGIGYDFDDEKQLEDILLSLADTPKTLLDMKDDCLSKAKSYVPKVAIQIHNFSRGGNKLYPLRLCTFSRVMREKGIEDAVNVVEMVNRELGMTVFTLDIYGQVDSVQTEWFNELQSSFPSYIRYGGMVPFDKSTDVLKKYFMLLFPSYYEGEGFAGSLIDAFSAGVPVVASDWKYNAEIVNTNVGFIYPTGDAQAFGQVLKSIALHPLSVISKKHQCLWEAQKYKIDVAVRILVERLNDDSV